MNDQRNFYNGVGYDLGDTSIDENGKVYYDGRPGGGTINTERDLCRQEDRPMTVEQMLRRMGGIEVMNRPNLDELAVIDYTVDRDKALEMIRQARATWDTYPDFLKERYPSPDLMIDAYLADELDTSQPPPKVPEPSMEEKLAELKTRLDALAKP